jgi:hypothetical protein
MSVLEMRTSERSSLKKCVQKWYWSQVEGLVPNRAANPLWFGSAVHEGLAAWYLPGLERGPHPAETFNTALEGERNMLVNNEDEEQEYQDARALGTSMLERYVDYYGIDDTWEVIATEQVFRVTMTRPEMEIFGHLIPALKGWLTYVGIWDGIFRDLITGEIWLMEHKTAASIRVDHLPLDDQAGSYWAIANKILRRRGLIGPNEKLAGIRYNFLRKSLGDDRPTNERGEATNQPQKIHYVDALYNFYGEDGDSEEMRAWATDLPKLSLAKLKEMAEVQKLQVLGEVSKIQPPASFERFDIYRSDGEQATMIDRIKTEAMFAAAYRDGSLPITKAPSRDCGWCAYEKICVMDEHGDQESVEDMKAVLFHTRNPYEDHVKKSAEGSS